MFMTSVIRRESDSLRFRTLSCQLSSFSGPDFSVALFIFSLLYVGLLWFKLILCRWNIVRKDLWSLVSLARDKRISQCFKAHIGELALGMGECIRFRILPLHLGGWRGTAQVIWQKGWCFLPQKHGVGIHFTTICYRISRTSLFRYCCYCWSCVPALTLRTVCLSKWLQVPCVLKQGQLNVCSDFERVWCFAKNDT